MAQICNFTASRNLGGEVVWLDEMPRLSALDLSDLQVNTASVPAAVGPQPLQQLAARLGPRVFSLTLSHNFTAGMQRILSGLAVSSRQELGEGKQESNS